MTRRYRDRRDAGRVLAQSLAAWRGRADAIVLALPRGGVPVAFEVAEALGLPLDVLVVRKLGLPAQPELAMGAVASGGARVLNEGVLRLLPPGSDALDRVEARERTELERREQAYRGDRAPLDLKGRVAIVVDDGLATGATMAAAVEAVRVLGAVRVVVAVPVASADALDRLADQADVIECPSVPSWFSAVGQCYDAFDQTEDAEVRDLLERATHRAAGESRGTLST